MYKLKASLCYEHIHLCYYRGCDIELTDFLFLLHFLIWLLMNNSNNNKKKVTEQSQGGERMLMFQTLSPVKWKIKRREEVSSSSLGTCIHAMLDFISQPQWPMWALFSVWRQMFASASSVWPSVGASAMDPHVSSPGETSGDALCLLSHSGEFSPETVFLKPAQTSADMRGFMKYRAFYLSMSGRTHLWASSRILKDASVTGPWISSWDQVNLKPKVSSQNAEFA